MSIFKSIILIINLLIWTIIIRKFFYKINFKNTLIEYKTSIYKIKSFSKDLKKSQTLLNNISLIGIVLILKTILISIPYFSIFLLMINLNFQQIFLIFFPIFPYLILFIK